MALEVRLDGQVSEQRLTRRFRLLHQCFGVGGGGGRRFTNPLGQLGKFTLFLGRRRKRHRHGQRHRQKNKEPGRGARDINHEFSFCSILGRTCFARSA